MISVVGNDQTQNITVSNQTSVDITANFDNVSIAIITSSPINISVIGNDDNIRIIEGKINLDASGNDDIFQLKNVTLLARDIVGNNMQVING